MDWDHQQRDLELYIDNTSELYGQKQAIEKHLQRKLKAGKYDESKAPKAWSYLVEAGAQMYCKEFGCSIRTAFPKRLVRDPLSEAYAREWEMEHGTAVSGYGRRSNPSMTKAQAWSEFKEMILPSIPHGDWPARREAWNNYTDMLCKDGAITSRQYETWAHPAGLTPNPKHTRPEKPRKKKRKTRKEPYARGRKGGGKRKNPISVTKLVNDAMK